MPLPTDCWYQSRVISHAWLFVTQWTAAPYVPLSSAISGSLLKFMSIELVMLSNHLILCPPLLLLPSVFPRIRVFSNELALCIKWQKYWSFSCSISLSNEYSGLISLGFSFWSPCSPRDSQESNTTIQKHQFFGTQPSLWSNSHICWYLTTGKTMALTRWTFVGKVTSLLFNTLSRFVIAFLPRSKCLLISWFQSPSAVLLEAKKKICHCFHYFPLYLPWSDETGCHDLSFLNVEF